LRVAGALQLLSSPRRCEILRLVWTAERSAGAIAAAMPDVTFGAVSLHLRALKDAGFVDARIDHRHRYYHAVPAALGPLAPVLEAMWRDALWRLKLAAELEESRRGPRPGRRTPRKRRRRA
jgi:DNA-binding transcriptional ArsR family regulator